MKHELSHPLLYLLQRLKSEVAEIRKWAPHWAEANLIPILRDISAAMDKPDLTLADIQRYVRPLLKILKQRDETRPLAELPELDAVAKMAGDHSKPLDDVIPLDKRIPNEIKTVADRVIEDLQAPPPGSPPPKSSTES
jgi:hypothetical protein